MRSRDILSKACCSTAGSRLAKSQVNSHCPLTVSRSVATMALSSRRADSGSWLSALANAAAKARTDETMPQVSRAKRNADCFMFTYCGGFGV